jgi:integrating conjugative element protein (TIGR03756 family)
MFKQALIFALCLWSPLMYADKDKNQITLPKIITGTLAATQHCLHYRPRGVCVWSVAHPIPHIVPSLKVSHYLPDLIVIVHNRDDDNPWHWAKKWIDKPAHLIGKKILKKVWLPIPIGYGQHNMNPTQDNAVYLKEVVILGNPAANLSGKFLTIPTTSTPLFPYFNSLVDVLSWRLSPESFLPKTWGTKNPVIGKTPEKWGLLYPRDGFINASNDAKAAAVIALRAAHIITHEKSLHIFKGLSSHCGKHCEASPINPGDSHAQWQMIYPVMQHHCLILGQQEDWGRKIAAKTHGQYIWIVWRHYIGCIPVKGGKLIHG